MLILVCNVGSTSLKYKLFKMPGKEVLVECKTERVGSMDKAAFHYINKMKGIKEDLSGLKLPTYTDGIKLFLKYLTDQNKGAIASVDEVAAIGFKTVLAKRFYGVHELTDEVIQAMRDFAVVAPAHNPPYIEAIEMFKKLLPGKLMVGVFETSFHTTIPLKRKLYALPYEWYEKYQVQRMGFHGSSHNYIAREITKVAGGKDFKLVSCHLGGSCSLCAIENGKSVDTSFGLSLQAGIPHSNRVGDFDAYVIPYLLQEGLTMQQIFKGLEKEGGLLGISGVSNDLRDVEEAAKAGNERAKLAVDIFCESIIKYIGAYAAEMGGLDYLSFTGGIGENSSSVRAAVCSRLGYFGIKLDEQANNKKGVNGLISTPDSKVKVYVIPANEELGIAQTILEKYLTSIKK
jgi:acetate kinase